MLWFNRIANRCWCATTPICLGRGCKVGLLIGLVFLLLPRRGSPARLLFRHLPRVAFTRPGSPSSGAPASLMPYNGIGYRGGGRWAHGIWADRGNRDRRF